jgi:LmbE family N-acetylglucosaminyl deacetylase
MTADASDPRTALPGWRSVLAVVAHPDDESFGLGAVLSGFADAGARTAVLCLTHGEASTLHGASGELSGLRSAEFKAAAALLRVRIAVLRTYPDGRLRSTCRTRLIGEVVDIAREVAPDGLLTFDSSGVTGHADHAAATLAACGAAGLLDLPVLGWTLVDTVADALNRERQAAFEGNRLDAIDFAIRVRRDRQRAAIAAHVSQAVADSILWRRLELQGDVEHLRWLRPSSSLGQLDPGLVATRRVGQ